MKTSRLVVHEQEMSYLIKESDNPVLTVIFIHGFPLGKEIWTSQLNALPKDIQGIAYDIRGYGDSHPGHGFFSIDLFAADLIGFIENLKLQRVVLCGISMGGYIALRAFERAPGVFSALILCDTNASSDPNEAKLNRFASIEKIQFEGKGAFANDFVKKIFADKTLEGNHDLVNFIYKMIMDLPESTLCASQLALASRTETIDVLPAIKIPTLVVRGAEDRLMSAEQARGLHDKIKNSRLIEIPLSGHLPNLENPEEFNKTMNDFLQTVKGA